MFLERTPLSRTCPRGMVGSSARAGIWSYCVLYCYNFLLLISPRKHELCSLNHQVSVHSHFCPTLLIHSFNSSPRSTAGSASYVILGAALPVLDQYFSAGKIICGCIIIRTRNIDPRNHEGRSDILKLPRH